MSTPKAMKSCLEINITSNIHVFVWYLVSCIASVTGKSLKLLKYLFIPCCILITSAAAFGNLSFISAFDKASEVISDKKENGNYFINISEVQQESIPTLAVEKNQSGGPNPVVSAGQVIQYTITVENTGNSSITQIVVSDKLPDGRVVTLSGPSGDSKSDGKLDSNERWTFTTSYTVTQKDIVAKVNLVNEVSVTTAQIAGPVTARATTTVSSSTIPGSSEASFIVTKSQTGEPNPVVSAGQVIQYTIAVENTGDQILTGIIASDKLPGGSVVTLSNPTGDTNTNGSLDPDETWTYTTSYTVTQVDIDAGANLVNEVSVTAAQVTVPVTSSATTPVSSAASLAVTKIQTGGPNPVIAAGQVIQYTITVENTGNRTITGIVASDKLPGSSVVILSGPTGDANSNGSLDSDETWTYTTSYTVTQADIDAGVNLVNEVSVTSTQVPGPVTASALTAVNATAALSVNKTASPLTYRSVGEEITYTIVLENTGNVTITNILVADPLTGLNETIESITPGTKLNFTPKYSIKQSDLSNGNVINIVTVTYNPGDEIIRLNDDVTVTALLPPLANNDINSDNISGNAVGIEILENDLLGNGSPVLPGLVSVDLNLPVEGIQAELTVSGEGVWSYNRLTGIVTFTPGAGFTTNPKPINYILTETSTGLKDTASITVDYNEGEPFAFNDVSSGNIPGNPVTINILANDKLSDGSQAMASMVSLDLNPTQTGIQLTVTVSGEGNWTLNPATGELVFTPVPGYTTNPSPLIYSLTEILTGLSDNGTVIFSYNEIPPVAADDTSSGNVPGTAVTIDILENDKLSDGSPVLPVMVTVDLDISLAGIQNELIVSGEGRWSLNPSAEEVTFSPQPGFTGTTKPATYRLTEILTGLHDDATIIITYNEVPPVAADDSIKGNEPGTEVSINILVNDRLSDNTPASPKLVNVDLDPVEVGIQSERVVAGQGTWKYNVTTGLLTFAPQIGFFEDPTPLSYRLCSVWYPTVCDEASVKIDYDQALSFISIGLVKTGIFSPADENISYTFEVTNTGNTPVWDIAIDDNRIGISSLSLATDTLYPGNKGTASVIYQITQADINIGNVTNSALAKGFTYNGEEVEDVSGSSLVNNEPTVTFLTQNPSIAVEKEAILFSSKAILNDVVDFNITVTNTGNVVLDEVIIEDPLTGFEQEVGQLVAGNSISYITSYIVQPEDELNGEFENTAIAYGKAPDGTLVEDSSTVIVEVEQCEMIIPTGFSPNDDGIQDTWRIVCVEKYPNARIEIYNRWGNLVFERENYGNTDVHGTDDAWWDGYASNKRTFGSSKLPAGTYYYILYLHDKREPLNGFIFLNR